MATNNGRGGCETTNHIWSIDSCPLCNKPHSKYRSNTDGDMIEYIICGTTHKRVNVSEPAWIKEIDIVVEEAPIM